MSFDAHEQRVMDLFNRKVYYVPRNQRRYVWNKDNWQELFDDIRAVVDGRISSHFIGSLVTIEFLSWDDEAKVHQKCTAAHVIICNAASGLVFRKWLCGCGNR